MSRPREAVSEESGIEERWGSRRWGGWALKMEKPLTGTHVSGDMLGPGKGGLTDWTLRAGVSRACRTTGRTGLALWSPAMVVRRRREEVLVEES